MLLKPGEPAETLGSVAVHACKESRCFHSRPCQAFRATFSCLEVRCLIRRGAEGVGGAVWDISEAKASALIQQHINYDSRPWGRGLWRNIPSHCFGPSIRLTLVNAGLHVSCCHSTVLCSNTSLGSSRKQVFSFLYDNL